MSTPSASRSPRNYLIWLEIYKYEVASIEGPFLIFQTNNELAPLVNAEVRYNLSPNTHNNIIHTMELVEGGGNPIDHIIHGTNANVEETVRMRFEYNETVAQAVIKSIADSQPIDVWLVMQPNILMGREGFEFETGNTANIINSIVVSGGQHFNIGDEGDSITTFLDENEALSRARVVLNRLGFEGDVTVDNGFTPGQAVAYGMVVTGDGFVRHLATVTKLGVPKSEAEAFKHARSLLKTQNVTDSVDDECLETGRDVGHGRVLSQDGVIKKLVAAVKIVVPSMGI